MAEIAAGSAFADAFVPEDETIAAAREAALQFGIDPVSPAIGAASFLGIIVTVGVAVSLVLDNYGLMSFDVHQAGIGRIVGGLLMIAGVACIAAF